MARLSAQLRQALGEECRSLLLKVRYPEGALTAHEYLALHFDDLAALLKSELALETHWAGRLDYEAGVGRLSLLAESALVVERLKMKRAHLKLAELLRYGCGEEFEVEIQVGDFPPPPPAGAMAGRPLGAQCSQRA